MCQSKTTGNGKRCLRHQAASTSTVHFSWAKTGVDKETIYATLKELNKEGRKLDAPELTEVKAFLKKEEFIVKHDPDLSERDRKLILKNLAKANDEAEKQSVSGGAFHAWKNVFSKTVEKIKKPLIAAGLVGVLAVSMAGCVGSVKPIDNNTDSPSPSNGGVVACSTENPGPWGDVIAKEKVTDEYGDYCRTTIDPKSDALKYDVSKVDVASLTEYGFTEDEAEKAQKAAVTIYAEEILDSTRFDNYSQSSNEWFEKNKEFIAPADQTIYGDAVKNSGETGLSEYGIIVTDVMPTPVNRTGASRASSTNISVEKVYATQVDGAPKPTLVVSLASTSTYEVNDSTLISIITKNDSTKTEESLKTSNPEFFDGKDGERLFLTGNTLLGFDKGNMKQLSGTSTNFKLTTGSGEKITSN